MHSDEIRKRFLTFFEKRGHAIIPSASLVPENDPSVLFTTAGMHPLVPYLLGQQHPAGKRVVDVQKCVRTTDIDAVGDNRHLTFFEMLGNWSFGDYFKKDAIAWSYEFLTSADEGLGLDPRRLYITVFEGDDLAPRDEESATLWQSCGIPAHRIYYMNADDNWWSPGDSGPSGPDSEMFYDITEHGLGDLSREEFIAAGDRGDIVEIWNDVFMEFEKKDGRVVGKLAQQNVDTGAGLERMATVLQKKKTLFETDLFEPIMSVVRGLTPNEKSQRIIADHVRASVFMIADGVVPSNTDRGYILRRLIRRAMAFSLEKNFSPETITLLVATVVRTYGAHYTELEEKKEYIEHVYTEEIDRFHKTLLHGLKEFERLSGEAISGKDAFVLFSTYGFPIELTKELAREKGVTVNEEEFNREMHVHQEISRAGSEQKFKGGLGDHSEMSVKYHTATHLLNQALHDVLGDHISQKGSNITPERLRYDFSHTQKMTPEEIARVETIVNEKIKADMPVHQVLMPRAEAEQTGARHAFNEKYGDTISIYYIGDSLENAYSKEFCGGPHVARTGVLGQFKIIKEEAVAAGIRRIKATLS